jgi:pseudouridine-5'-phosphate glycosidase
LERCRIRISEEIQQALLEQRGVVALGTTLVAHDFPPGEGVAARADLA